MSQVALTSSQQDQDQDMSFTPEQQQLLDILHNVFGVSKAIATTAVSLKPNLERLETQNKTFKELIQHARGIACLPSGDTGLQFELEEHVQTTLKEASELVVSYCKLPTAVQNVLQIDLVQRIIALPVITAEFNKEMRTELVVLGIVPRTPTFSAFELV